MELSGTKLPDGVTPSRRLSSLGVGVVATALLAIFAASVAAAPAPPDQQIDLRLEVLRPLLGKTWQGTLASPDGARSFVQAVSFEPMAGGKVVKITKTNRDLGTRAEGFVFWDDISRKVRVFLVESAGVFSEGTVTSEGTTITLEGTMTWPQPPPDPSVKQSYQFRNTFEILSDTSMRESWFQNAFGPWRPGHVIEFEAVPAGDGASTGEHPDPSSGSKRSQSHESSAVLIDRLFKAVDEGDSEEIRKLAGAHPDLLDLRNAAGSTALLSAVRADRPHVVKLLLDLGADPSARDRFGFSPLHRAAENDRLEVVEMLLARKADVDPVVLEGYYGYTPLTFAILKGNLETVRRLHAVGADIHRRTQLGESYLHFASALNRVDIAEYFIARGLDVNTTKAGRLTPLHIAAITGRREMTEFLIRRGADLDASSTDFGTPLHFAQAGGNTDIAELLRRRGAADRPRAFPEYKGRYLGQKPPGPVPKPFAPELFRDIYRAYGPPVFSPDGTEVFFYGYFMPWIGYSRIWWMKEENGRWTAPVLAPFSDHPSWGPAFSPDGKRLFFASRRSRDGTSTESTDLWFAEKRNGAWGRAQCLGSPPNRDDHDEMLATVAADGSLYFMAFGPSARGTRIWRSLLTNGRLTNPVSLDDLIDQGLTDESRGIGELISYRYFGSRYAEISILFRHPDGRWTRPVSLGDLVHQGHGTNAGVISPDRRYFFFCQDITPHWVDAFFIEHLRREALKPAR